MREVWRNIKGYEDLYQVSNLGRVKSLSRKIFNGKNYYISKEKILSLICFFFYITPIEHFLL